MIRMKRELIIKPYLAEGVHLQIPDVMKEQEAGCWQLNLVQEAVSPPPLWYDVHEQRADD